MSDEMAHCQRMLQFVAQDPGVSVHWMAKQLKINLVETLKVAYLLAEDDGFAPGPALVRLETKNASTLTTRAWLTEAGEVLVKAQGVSWTI